MPPARPGEKRPPAHWLGGPVPEVLEDLADWRGSPSAVVPEWPVVVDRRIDSGGFEALLNAAEGPRAVLVSAAAGLEGLPADVAVFEDTPLLAARVGRWLSMGAVAPTDGLARDLRHDVRTPLGVVLGRAEMLAGGYLGELDDRQRHAVEAIVRNALSVQQLLERLDAALSRGGGDPARSA